MRKGLRYVALVAAVLVLAGSGAVASNDNDFRKQDRFVINLEGFQENPSISTTGNGRLFLRIDDRREEITYALVYSDLEGAAPEVPAGQVLFAHIHFSARHVNGPVAAFLCGGGGKGPCPPEGTVMTGTIVAADMGTAPSAIQGLTAGEPTLFEELVRAIRAGYTYGNVHTTRWPGGEIRGQIPADDHDNNGHGHH